MPDQNAAVLARIRQMADAWEQRLPETIRTATVVDAIRTALEPVSSAGQTPATARAALRDRIAHALEREDAINAGYDHGFVSQYGIDEETDGFVDAVLAALPEPADRAAVLREAADRYEVILASAASEHSTDPRYYTGVRDMILGLRRLADEAQPVDRERVKHSGPDTKFCALCLSGEHERLAAEAQQDGTRP